jgi:peroxiredoxin
MKRYFFTLAILSFLFSGIMAQETDGTLTKVGQVAPAFKCETINGKVINSEELKGKVILVNFFATWCPPCRLELPVLQETIYNKYKDNPDFVLVILGREEDSDLLKEFAKTKELDLPFAPDLERKIFSKYAEISIPRNVVIDRKGNISYQSIGYSEEEFKHLQDHLANLLD